MKIPDRLSVLDADDDEDNCFMVTTMLELSDFEVTTAVSIEEAWKIAQVKKFDLYLLDSRFPEGSGLDLCRILREYAPKTPILFYSADAYKSDVIKGFEAGADQYLTKPYLEDLALTILKAIKNTKNNRQKNCSYSFLESQQKDDVKNLIY